MQELKNKLESLIDSNSVASVLLAMSEVCTEKSQHIRDNYQDKNLAKQWDRASDKLFFANKDVTV